MFKSPCSDNKDTLKHN